MSAIRHVPCGMHRVCSAVRTRAPSAATACPECCYSVPRVLLQLQLQYSYL